MTITAVTIQNFKGIGEPVRIELKPITLLFGANSAGKSSVLQALLYVREVMARRNTDPDRTQLGGDFVDLGGFRNMVHNHDLTLSLVAQFELNLASVDLVDYLEDEPTNVLISPVSRLSDQQAAIDLIIDDGVKRRLIETKSNSTRDSELRDMFEEQVSAKSESLLERLSADAQTATVRIAVKWSSLVDEPVQADYEVSLNGTPAARIRTDSSSGTQHSIDVNQRHAWFGGLTEAEGGGPTLSGSDPSDPEWLALRPRTTGTLRAVRGAEMTLLDEMRGLLSLFDLDEFAEVLPFVLTAPGEYLLRQLNDIRYLGPIREVPSRTHTPALSPELSRWANGLGAWDWIHNGSTEQLSELNAWLTRNDRLNTGYRVDVKRFKELNVESSLMVGLMDSAGFLDNYQSIRDELEALPVKSRTVLRQEGDSLEVGPQDIGIGISQVIPVVVSAIDGGDRMTVIEQPELHIHPAIQVALGDLFIEVTRPADGGAPPCFLIETHSEHLLLRLLRRIRETEDGVVESRFALTPEALAVYFVEATSTGTSIRSLSVDERGNFAERWPKGFFDEREREIFGDVQAISDEELNRVLGR